jgi:hypothetical protein
MCIDSAAEESSNDPVVYVYRASHNFPARNCRVQKGKSRQLDEYPTIKMHWMMPIALGGV